MNRAEQAEFYIWALGHDLVEVSKVIEWADSVILEDPSPELAFINLALTGSKEKYKVMDALSEIPGEVNKEKVFREKISSLYELLCRNKDSAAWVSPVLLRMMILDEISDEDFKSRIYQIDDAFEYILDDKTEITKELLSLLSQYSS